MEPPLYIGRHVKVTFSEYFRKSKFMHIQYVPTRIPGTILKYLNLELQRFKRESNQLFSAVIFNFTN